MPPRAADLLQGTLDMLVMRAVADEPLHGYALVQRLKLTSGGRLTVPHGSLYPALHRLERKGWVESEWGISDNNRRAKFYRHTAAGRAQFRAKAPAWHRYADAIAAALRATSPDVVGA